MFLADYHCHSAISPDGRDAMSELLEAAALRGLSEIAVTDHCDMSRPFDHAAHRRAFEEAARSSRAGVRLLYAIEQGDGLHDKPRAEHILQSEDYDFVLGSYHALKGGEDFYKTRYRSAGQCYAALDAYMDELAQTARWGMFDVMGHLTYPLRYMSGRDGIKIEFYERYETAMRQIFGELVSRGKGIEVNVSGLCRSGGDGKPMPTADILALWRACGGEIVTVGSDAHRAGDVGCGVRQGMEILRGAGFEYVARYEKRKVFFEKF